MAFPTLFCRIPIILHKKVGRLVYKRLFDVNLILVFNRTIEMIQIVFNKSSKELGNLIKKYILIKNLILKVSIHL